MSTLRELIDQHRDQVPGLKVRVTFWGKDRWFEVAAIRGTQCIGWHDTGTGDGWDMRGEPHWELYQPPAPTKAKRKVMMYPALYADEGEERHSVSRQLFRDTKEAELYMGSDLIRFWGRTW